MIGARSASKNTVCIGKLLDIKNLGQVSTNQPGSNKCPNSRSMTPDGLVPMKDEGRMG